MTEKTDLPHILGVFVGRSKHGLGDRFFYRSSLPGAEVEACHAAACVAIGLERWDELLDSAGGLRKTEAAVLFKIPDTQGYFEPDPTECRYPWILGDGVDWSDVYLHVARHGATLLGKALETAPITGDEIDAGGEYFGYVQ